MSERSGKHFSNISGDRHWERFPKTRYAGSKRKLLPLLANVLGKLEFDTALDPFCGTGSVAYLLKCLGAEVTASDTLESNVVAARALIQNSTETLGDGIEELVSNLPKTDGPIGIVEHTFDGIFFERHENRFIDQILPRIDGLPGARRDLAMYSLFQACLAKRPYNLFHRANLAMRTRDVARSFGNKVTWDTPFNVHMKRYATAADAAVFDSGRACRAVCSSALDMDPTGCDLVYIDPPYVSSRGKGVDYLDYYHFLEGLCDPENWEERVLMKYKHRPLQGRGQNPWCDPAGVSGAFEETIKRFCGSILLISYRSDGIPGIDEIAGFLKHAGKHVEIVDAGEYVYALSRNRKSREIVLVGR
jgi:adenine-specific DNA-methyltransferase